MAVLGTCQLCQQEGVELCDSHLLPKAGYRLVRKSNDNEAPILIKRDVSISKDEHVRGHVFCEDCEGLLSRNGEAWVLQNCFRHEEGFALKSALGKSKPEHDNGKQLTVYAAKQVKEIDVAKLVYFAASVFWRVSAHPSKSDGYQLNSPKLGKEYDEKFRQYLLGNTEFPKNATLWLSVIIEEGLWNYFAFPYGAREDDYHRSHFQFMGLAFDLFLGGLVPKGIRQFCLASSDAHYIAMSQAADDMIIAHSGRLIAKSKPAGALHREGR